MSGRAPYLVGGPSPRSRRTSPLPVGAVDAPDARPSAPSAQVGAARARALLTGADADAHDAVRLRHGDLLHDEARLHIDDVHHAVDVRGDEDAVALRVIAR